MEKENMKLHVRKRDNEQAIFKSSYHSRSGWVCHLFGSDGQLTYWPEKDCEPNFFVRFMMRICLGCRWEKVEK